jgi:dephospho-CoA kinase
LRPYLIEEAYEVLDVIDQIHTLEDLKKLPLANHFKEELGDLLMQVILHAEMTSEHGIFNIYDVAESLNQKLIRRHPHVFGETKESSAENAVKRWEQEKIKEKKGTSQSGVLAGIPKGLPSLQRSTRVIEKVTRVGFQWDDMAGPLAKVEEELEELKKEVLDLEKLRESSQKNSGQNSTPPDLDQENELKKRIESELGDLLFTLSNVAHLNKINPEDALRGTLSRFENRFRHVENRLKWQGKTPEQSHLAEMDTYWSEAKVLEKMKIWGLTGGIASGKSTAAGMFRELGIPVIDADQISRELSQEGGAAHNAILQRFGTADRSHLRELIFKDPQAKADLEAILHPLIQAKSTDEMLQLARNHSHVIYEATLLVETGRYQNLSGLITVECSRDLQISRLSLRNQFSPTFAASILENQASNEERRQHSTWILENNSDLNDLRHQIDDLVKKSGWTPSQK